MERTRDAVKGAFKSKKWATRVDGMTDDQVVAIFMRLRLQGKIT